MLLASVALFGSCEDFLSKEDPNKIDAPSYFRNETDLQTYVNGFLQTMSPTAASVATGDARTDCLAWRGEYQFLTDNFDADDQSGWGTSDWEDLRNINYFLDNFRQAAVSETTLAHYEGVARFWRAYFYWNKVKTFGAVPWYDSTIDSNDHEALYKPRDSREYVMRKVLEDIEFASTYCTSSSALEVNSVQITRYVALALKARICLYEGTFRKYHANDPSTGKPWTADEAETYLRAAVSACNETDDQQKVFAGLRSGQRFDAVPEALHERIRLHARGNLGPRLQCRIERDTQPQLQLHRATVRQLLADQTVHQYLSQPRRFAFHRQTRL